jgi:hypothetical protein
MSLLDALAAVPPGWPFPPIVAAALALAVAYVALIVLAPTPSDLE